MSDTNRPTTETLEDFNARMARDAHALHDRMAEGGHPATPEEAKFLLVVGWAALGESVGVDVSPLMDTARRLAEDLP